MIAALSAALAGHDAVIVAAEDGDAVAKLRAAAPDADMILLVITPIVPKLDRAMLLAAIGPFALECAPDRRIAALDIADGALAADVAAAALFLIAARSTTGQTLRIGPRG